MTKPGIEGERTALRLEMDRLLVQRDALEAENARPRPKRRSIGAAGLTKRLHQHVEELRA